MAEVRRVKKTSTAPSSQGPAHPNTLGLLFLSWQVLWFHSLFWLSIEAVIGPAGSCKCSINRSQGYNLGPEWETASDKEHSLPWGFSSTKSYMRNKFKIAGWPIETISLFTSERISCSEQKQLVWSQRSFPNVSLPGFSITAADADPERSRRGKTALLQSCCAADEWLFLLNKPIQASAPQPFTWWAWTIMNQD